MPEIQDQIKRMICYESETSEEISDELISIAFECLSVAYWNEACSMTNTFIIYADTDEELEEKTLELISAMDYGKLNIKINIENNSDVITGFNTDEPNPDLPSNMIDFEDGEDNPMVIYYNTFDDVFSDMSLSDRVIYAEDYPRNTYINGLFKELGIETEDVIEAYGEVVILTKKVSLEV